MNGTALHYVLTNTEVSRFDLSFLTQYPLLINVMTYSALVMEFSLAFFLWFRATRPYVILLGLMLHTGILITINIPVFGELMWIGYLAFLTPPEFNALLHAIDVRRLLPKRKARLGAVVEEPEPVPLNGPIIRLEPEEEAEAEAELEDEDELEFEPDPMLSFRSSSSIFVRLDGPSGLAGPHRIDAGASRPREESAARLER